MFTIGATQCSHSAEGQAITASGARFHWHCGENDHVLTIGFHKGRVCGGGGGGGGGAV